MPDRPLADVAPVLRAVGRLSAGSENLDLDAFARAGVEIVRPATPSPAPEAEFAIGAMLQLLRRVPVRSNDGLLVGRELSGATVGLLGMTAAARPLAELLSAFSSKVLGYDPALHPTDGLWERWKIQPTSLRSGQTALTAARSCSRSSVLSCHDSPTASGWKCLPSGYSGQ